MYRKSDVRVSLGGKPLFSPFFACGLSSSFNVSLDLASQLGIQVSDLQPKMIALQVSFFRWFNSALFLTGSPAVSRF